MPCRSLALMAINTIPLMDASTRTAKEKVWLEAYDDNEIMSVDN